MMHEKKHFFGIGVASYEQHDGLLRTIKNLVDVQEHLAKEYISLPIVVSDNNSRNFPEEQFQSYTFGADFKLIHQKENLGFAGNMSFLMSSIDANFILILGCGETILSIPLEQLIRHLMESDVSRTKFLGGTFGDVNRNELGGDILSHSPNHLAVNRAISLNVWNSKYFDEELLSKNRENSWPHIELAIDIHNRCSQGSYFYYHNKVVVLDQPSHGWHNSNNFLRLILQLDELIRENKRVNLGPSIVENWRPVGSWIYYFRRSKKERVQSKEILAILFRLWTKPHAVAYIISMSTLPKPVIRVLSRSSRCIIAALTFKFDSVNENPSQTT